MKTLYALAASVITTLAVVSCSQDSAKSNEGATQGKEIAANMATAQFNIDGMMSSAGCATHIEKTLSGLKGVKNAHVNFESKKAEVSFDSSKLTEEDIATTVTTIGDGHTYKVYNMAKISDDGHRGGNGKADAHSCSEECTKGGCTAEMKAHCTPEMKANCPMKKK